MKAALPAIEIEQLASQRPIDFETGFKLGSGCIRFNRGARRFSLYSTPDTLDSQLLSDTKHMRKPFKIGSKEYSFKKDATAHYRAILNAYDFDQSLNDSDFGDMIDLVNYDKINVAIEDERTEENAEEANGADEQLTNEKESKDGDLVIQSIKVAKVQFNTKCFEVLYTNNTSRYISYLMLLNGKRYDAENLFSISCRNSIHDDIRSVKQEYFDKNSVKGQVKCQETGKLSTWTDLVVDHRQPNTFSMIVDRFKEVSGVELESLEFTWNDRNHIIFKDQDLARSFIAYHQAKATLRIVRKECNSSRTGMARMKKSTRDLTISDKAPAPAGLDSEE